MPHSLCETSYHYLMSALDFWSPLWACVHKCWSVTASKACARLIPLHVAHIQSTPCSFRYFTCRVVICFLAASRSDFIRIGTLSLLCLLGHLFGESAQSGLPEDPA